MAAIVILLLWPRTSYEMRREISRQFKRDLDSRIAMVSLITTYEGESDDTSSARERNINAPIGDAAVAAVKVLRSRGNLTVTSEFVNRLRSLYPNFPKSVELRALVLRLGCSSDIAVRRQDVNQFTEDNYTPSTVKPVDLEPYLRDAEVGESMDPANGFFPTMSAIILFNQHKDREALDALHRAATAKGWDDYANWETGGQIRMQKLIDQADSIHLLGVGNLVMYPHFATLRALAISAALMAYQHEVAGNLDAGIAIRRDVALLGSNIRVHAHHAFGILVGATTTSYAAYRFGGSPLPQRKQPGQRFRWSVGYPAYLRRIGHPSDAAWFVEESNLSSAARTQLSAAMGANPIWMQGLASVVKWSSATFLAATFATWYSLLSLFGFFYDRRRQRRAERGNHAEEPILAVVLVTAILVGLGVLGHIQWERINSQAMLAMSFFNLSGQAPPAWVSSLPSWSFEAAIICVLALPLLALGIVSTTIAIVKRRPMLRMWARALFKVGYRVVVIATIALCASLPRYVNADRELADMIEQSSRDEMGFLTKRSGRPFPGPPKTELSIQH